jgi:hypothetical protein
VPLQADDPASKFWQLKEGLQTFLAGQTNAQLGFATFNQDALRVGNKHWIYQAQGAGPTISGWGPYPAAGAKEVFGFNWGCDTGSNDNEIGCTAAKPADLPDAWELTRVQRLPKGGTFTPPVTFYVRSGTITYRVTYTPATGSLPGASSVTLAVRLDRCTTAACTSTSFQGQSTVTWAKVSEFLSWDNAESSNTHRFNPEMTFFGPQASDALATNTCSGWDPNTDSTQDLSGGYGLRWPTNSSDPRGTYFTLGDVLPPDDANDHNLDIQARLAPNLVLNPSATPDFSTAPYLRDTRTGSETFLRLKDERQRPLLAVGTTPILASVQSFRTWYAGWRNAALASDPLFSCRRQALLLLVDGEETCSPTTTTCTAARDLYNLYNVRTYVVSFGSSASPWTGSLTCIAQAGSTTSPLFPQTKSELTDTLQSIFTALQNP